MVRIDQSRPASRSGKTNSNRVVTTNLRYAFIIAAQIPLIVFLLLPGVLSRHGVMGEPWPNFAYAWNVMLAAVIADGTICSVILLTRRRNARRVSISIGCTLFPLMITFALLPSGIATCGGWLVPIGIAVFSWIIGGFINEQIENPPSFRLPRIQFTLGELMMAMFVIACVVGFISLIISLRDG